MDTPTEVQAAGLPFEEAIDFFRSKVPVHSQHWTDVWRTAHSLSFMVAGAASDALLADFQGAIRKALGSGTTLAEFRRDFDSIVARRGWVYNGAPGWRAPVIYETNLATAYAAGRYAQLTAPETKAAYPFWHYVHSGSHHPRLQHLAWNGLTLRCDDAFWDTHFPPNGWHCGCRVRPVSDRDLTRMGKDGPDQAPPPITRSWVNPNTGELHRVPIGIDPGFDYNPGQAWKDRTAELPPSAGATGAPPPRPHPLAAFDPLPTADLAHANERLAEATQHAAAGMTPAANAALAFYKGRGGRDMNATLRDIDAAPAEIEVANTLAAVLRRAEAPMDVRAWRGMSAAEAAQFDRVGKRVKSPGFVSTSIDRAVAATAGAVCVESACRGTRGAMYVHPFPSYRFRQYELLLTAGMVLRVVSNTGGVLVLEAVGGDIAN